MQTIRFSDQEGLRIAAEMERRGGEFYRHAARIAKSPATVALLQKLAEDEAVHEQEFHRLRDKLITGDPDDEYYDEEASAYLSAVAAEVVFQGGLMGLVKDRGFEKPEAILQTAIQSEKDSILFYSEMAQQAKRPQAATVFSEIVRQEKHHLGKLQKMLMDLSGE